MLDGVDDLRGLREKAPAGRRQRHPGRRAFEERDAEPLFERLDVPGDRRLAQMQRFGRSCEVTELGNRDESAQLIEIQRASRRGNGHPCEPVYCIATNGCPKA